MKHVQLVRLSLHRFKSYRNDTVIEFDPSPGLRLIEGRNEVDFAEPDGNGCGKSSIWDALSFVQNGASVHGLRASDLISRGERDTDVEAILEIDGTLVSVQRTAPPSRAFINGQPVEQQEVDRIFGMSRARFLNTVILGQNVPTFLDLSTTERGDLLEEVHSLQHWLSASRLADTKASKIESEITQKKMTLARLHGEFTGLPDLNTLRAQSKSWSQEQTQRLEEKTKELEEVESLLIVLEERKANRKRLLPRVRQYEAQCNEIRNRIQQLNSRLSVIVDRQRRLQDEDSFFSKNKTCPTCGQGISPDHASKHFEHSKVLLSVQEQRREEIRIKIESDQEELEIALEAQRRAQVEVIQYSRETTELDGKISLYHHKHDALTQQIEEIRTGKDPYQDTIEGIRSRRRELRAQIASINQEILELERRQTSLIFWKQAFKRTRLFCLSEVVAQLEMVSNNLIGSIGLLGYRLGFTTETVTRSGTARLGVQATLLSGNTQVPFPTLSGGEKQRVCLCTALGLGQLIQDWSGVSYGFEVYDEPSAWLSERGIENLLQCLKDRSDTTGKSIYVCDHRALTYSGFNSIITVVNDHNGSRIERP
jgi:DNA repair exonuclease SbcCD ATPase subunit